MTRALLSGLWAWLSVCGDCGGSDGVQGMGKEKE
jgi:hypothetical protein